jgi:hypothetical protein
MTVAARQSALISAGWHSHLSDCGLMDEPINRGESWRAPGSKDAESSCLMQSAQPGSSQGKGRRLTINP